MSDMYVSFDDLESLDSTDINKPFFAIDYNNVDTVLTWLKQQLLYLKNDNETRLEKVKNNYLRYKGYQYFNTVYYPRDVLESQRRYTPQMVLPLISDAVDEKTARIMESKPNITVLPVHDETMDKVDAKVAKQFLDHVTHAQKLDTKFMQALKNSYIAGESFLWVKWNPDAGDILPEAQMMGEFQTLGDVEVVKKTAHHVFYEKAETWEKVNYCFIIEYDYVEALKRDYPEQAQNIHEDVDARMFNYDKMEQVSMKGMCRKIHFYHKKTKHLPQGFEACFVMGALLKHGPLSYNHGQLPIERMVDIQNDEELPGQSFIDKTKSIASNINNALNAVVKAFMLTGYPKWFVEAGSVDIQNLNNDISIVKVKAGAREPKLAQANPVSESQFKYIETLKRYYYEFAKSNSVVRGDPPPGVTASVALQYLSESESRRLNTDVQQFNAFVRGTYELILKTVSQFYKPDEQRTMLLIGKDNRWEVRPLDPKTLAKNYSVLIQNTSGLSDSKAARTQQLIDLSAAFPQMLPQEQVLEMTGLAQADKFQDIGSRAARAAEDENEQMSDGGELVEPKEWEEHATHWRIHVQEMQAKGFKDKASEEIQNNFVKHIMAHEMLMMDKASINPLYQEQLAKLIGFPLFMEAPLAAPTVLPSDEKVAEQMINPQLPPEIPQEIPQNIPQ